jgi:polyhydroxyalkanoate synthesis regulator phasin
VLDVLRTFLLAGIGAIDLTESRVRDLADDLVRRGQLAVDDARELAAIARAADAERRSQRESRLRDEILAALASENVASHATVAELQARVAGLEEELARLAAAAAPAAEP